MGIRRMLVLLTLGTLPMQALPADEAQFKRGRLLFMQCRACHDTEPSDAQKVGPNLYGIMGRAAASGSEYSFSEALAKSGIVWTAETLERWIERPSALVPGTTMVFAGVNSAADRAALVAFLERATASSQVTAER